MAGNERERIINAQAGQRIYEALGKEIGSLVEEKHKQYGDSFARSGEMLRVLYPNGIQPYQMDDAMAITRILDKLFRIAQRGEDGLDKGGESPYGDIAGYGLLGLARDRSNE